jgi:hypothetical protein
VGGVCISGVQWEQEEKDDVARFTIISILKNLDKTHSFIHSSKVPVSHLFKPVSSLWPDAFA